MIEIEYDMHPLQYFNLVVTDWEGNVISDTPYSHRFSPLGSSRTLRLAPGEKFIAPVGLLGNVPDERQKPGCYSVVAIYQYRTLKVVSQPFQVRLE